MTALRSCPSALDNCNDFSSFEFGGLGSYFPDQDFSDLVGGDLGHINVMQDPNQVSTESIFNLNGSRFPKESLDAISDASNDVTVLDYVEFLNFACKYCLFSNFT